MNHRKRLAMALALLLPACAEDRDADAAAAMRLVDEFQTALRAGDSAQCRRLVTGESAAAIADLPWHAVRHRQPLKILDAVPEASGYRVQVEDPNDGGRRGDFLVVREYGQLLVDLVATAGLTAEFTERPLAEEQFVPQELTPADIDRAIQMQLAKPPR